MMWTGCYLTKIPCCMEFYLACVTININLKKTSVMQGIFFQILQLSIWSKIPRSLLHTFPFQFHLKTGDLCRALRKSANSTRTQTGQLADLLHHLQISHNIILHIAPTYPQCPFILSSWIIPSVILLMTLYVLYVLPISPALILVTLRFQIRVAHQL